MTHRYHICHGKDADYIVYESWTTLGHFWIEHTRWLIPGTQIED